MPTDRPTASERSEPHAQRLRRGFRLGPHEIDPLAGRVTGPKGTLHLEPKVVDVLLYLALHAGELVERDTLLGEVWGRTVSEEVLTRCISELRRALGDDRATPSYIQTVPKRGYRLIEQVVVSEPRENTAKSADGAAAAKSPPAIADALASVAVLPFDNHSADSADRYMGEAFATELHGTLARVDRLRVASRRSSFVFKDATVDLREIASRLNVDYVLSGSVRCTGQRLRVLAELNDARRGTQLWAQSYDRDTTDLLAVEKELAEAVVGSFATHQLKVETHDARRMSTDGLDAWGLVQKARSFVFDYTAEGLAAAVELLRRAIALDAEYAAAHATLASTLAEQLFNGFSADAARDESAAVAAAGRALALAPNDPFILKMVSMVFVYAGDHRRALQCLRRAIGYAPFDFGAWGYMGWSLAASGEQKDLDELRRIQSRLLAMEPNHPGVAFWLLHKSVADVCEGLYEAAREAAEAAIEHKPALSFAWMHYANILGQLDDRDGGRRALERCRQVNAAMTPKHYERLIRRLSSDEQVIERRTGGLRNLAGRR